MSSPKLREETYVLDHCKLDLFLFSCVIICHVIICRQVIMQVQIKLPSRAWPPSCLLKCTWVWVDTDHTPASPFSMQCLKQTLWAGVVDEAGMFFALSKKISCRTDCLSFDAISRSDCFYIWSNQWLAGSSHGRGMWAYNEYLSIYTYYCLIKVLF